MKTLRYYLSGMTFRMIAGTAFCILLFNLIAGAIGYAVFTDSLTREYNDSAYRTALAAASLVDGDEIDRYLSTGGDTDDYRDRAARMDRLCQLLDVTLLYVIDVDTSDYGRFRSVFNATREDSGYTPWAVGYERETTNAEYAAIYRDIYENGLERGAVTRTRDLNGKPPHITSLVPVKNSAGAVAAILCVQRPMEELATGRHIYLRNAGLSALGMVVLAAFALASFLWNQFVKPTKRIIAETRRFAAENTPAEGTALAHVSQVRELRELMSSVGQLEGDVVRYTEHLTKITAERERIGAELNVAARIQASMLPRVFPPFPDRPEFDLWASMDPAKEVGGDFYDFFLVDSDHLALVIADVSGKGVPAALFMVIAKTLLKNAAQQGLSPQAVLEKVNGQLCEGNDAEMFVTVWLGILELSTGKLTCANAGHEYPALRHADGNYELLRDKHGMVLAAMEGLRYSEYTVDLAPGDCLFVYTDGVAEATDPQGQLFGTQRMLAALDRASRSSTAPEEFLPLVRQSVDAFVQGADQFDDITMLALRYKGRAQASERPS